MSRRRPSDQNDVKGWPCPACGSCRGTQDPLGPVAHHGASKFLPRNARDATLRVASGWRWCHEGYEVVGADSARCSKDSVDLTRRPDGAHLELGAENAAALAPSGGENPTAAASRHARSETVRLRPLPIVWLVCPLHEFPPRAIAPVRGKAQRLYERRLPASNISFCRRGEKRPRGLSWHSGRCGKPDALRTTYRRPELPPLPAGLRV